MNIRENFDEISYRCLNDRSKGRDRPVSCRQKILMKVPWVTC